MTEREQQQKFRGDTSGTKGVRTEPRQEVSPSSGTENGMEAHLALINRVRTKSLKSLYLHQQSRVKD